MNLRIRSFKKGSERSHAQTKSSELDIVRTSPHSEKKEESNLSAWSYTPIAKFVDKEVEPSGKGIIQLVHLALRR